MIYLKLRAINMLPRTLATIGESIMRQTGWNVSILAGGPTPDSGGMIMTYLFVKLFTPTSPFETFLRLT
jgi:hypothetical protein